MIIKELRKKLFDVYAEWYSNLSKNAVIKDENISLPYFIYLPDNWAVSPIRILIVGEEGYGYIGGQTDKRVATGDVISKIQNFNHNCFSDKTLNRRPFWRRISYLRESFPNACFCWTNLDKVHRLKAEGSKSSCKLLKAQREALHEYPILQATAGKATDIALRFYLPTARNISSRIIPAGVQETIMKTVLEKK